MLISRLRPYQKEGKAAALAAFKTDKGFLIGDEMGLGKTVQALAVADVIRKKFKRVAIIAPAGLVPKWRDEIKKHLPAQRGYAFSLASYNDLTNPEKLHFFTRQGFDLAICDEAHYLKDFASQRTRAVLGAPGDVHRTLANVSAKLLGLSGTWPPNRVGEVYPWLYRTEHALTRNLTYEQFLYKHAASVRETAYGLQHKGVKDEVTFRRLLAHNFIYRKMDEVEKDIPAGSVVNVPIECGPAEYEMERKLLTELLTLAGHPPSDIELIYHLPDFLEKLLETVPGFAELSEFRKRVGFMKVKPVFDYLVESVLPETQKFIVFCYHTEVAEKYVELLKKTLKTDREIVHLITGKNSDKENRFKTLQTVDRSPRAVLVGTMDAMREGFDLTGFTHSFYAESDWRLYVIDQTHGRTRRIGQTKPVFWTHFNFDKGVENLMARRLSEKADDLKKIRGK